MEDIYMETKEDLIQKLEWNNNIKNIKEKEVLARKIALKVKNRRCNKFWFRHNFFFGG